MLSIVILYVSISIPANIVFLFYSARSFVCFEEWYLMK